MTAVSGERLIWIDAGGTEHPLSHQPNFDVIAGKEGLSMPPMELIEEEVPYQAGSRIRLVKTRSRQVVIPLLIQEQDRVALWNTLRTILGWFNPTLGDGTLRVVAPDGSIRDLRCRYQSGIEGRMGGDAGMVYWQKLGLQLLASDPYWYDYASIAQTFTIASVATFFPIFPVRLTASTVFAQPTINNPGDVEAWPIWTVTGPGSGLTLLNRTSGESLAIAATLSATDILDIDTRPGVKTARLRSGANLFPQDDSVLWPLDPGVNSVEIQFSGTAGGTAVALSYTPRYLGV